MKVVECSREGLHRLEQVMATYHSWSFDKRITVEHRPQQPSQVKSFSGFTNLATGESKDPIDDIHPAIIQCSESSWRDLHPSLLSGMVHIKSIQIKRDLNQLQAEQTPIPAPRVISNLLTSVSAFHCPQGCKSKGRAQVLLRVHNRASA